MDFLNPLLAFGAATFAVPVAIHLIFRMRKRRVVFSSLRFLQMSMLKESRRLKLRELILLLLRCLACILIALSFARPFRNDSVLAGPGGRPAEDAMLVLDDSPSMNAQEGAGTRWQNALKQARDFLSSRESRDRAGLVLTGDATRAAVELTGNFATVASELKHERPSALRGDLAAAVSTALDQLAASTQPRKRVLVISDFQTTAIDRGAWAALAQKAASIGRGAAVELLAPASVAQGPTRLANLAVTDVRAKSDVWIENRPVPFIVRVANDGNNELPAVSVKLVVNGSVAASRILGLGPRSSTEVELDAVFPKAGEVSGYAEVEAHDAFPDDDRRLFALRLRDSIRVLVIEDKLAEKDAFLDQGYFVRMALEPKARGVEEPHGSNAGAGAGVGNYIQALALEASKVTPENYRNADLIVLAGVSALTDGELLALEDAVREGKNLIVFTGRSDGRLSEAFYNGAFWKHGLGLLPARPGNLFEGNRLENRFDKIGKFNAGHALFKPFVGENDANLRLPRFYRHYQPSVADLKMGAAGVDEKSPALAESVPVAPAIKDEPKKSGAPEGGVKARESVRPEGKVLASFTGEGGPFALERAYGKGTVLMFPFAARPEATDLPKRKAFVPLLHQAVRWLAGSQSASRRSLMTGDAFDFADAGAPPDAVISLEKPNAPGTPANAPKETLSVGGNEHPVATLPGLYASSFMKGGIQERTLWAVNLDPRESELASEPLGSLKAVFAGVAADESAAKIQAQALSAEQKALAPEWRYCLIAALACLMLEVLLRDFWMRS